MSERQILIVALRLAAVLILVTVLGQAHQWIYGYFYTLMNSSDDWQDAGVITTMLVYAGSILVMLGLATIFWLRPEWFLRSTKAIELKEGDTPKEAPERNFVDLHFTLLSVLGTWFIFNGTLSLLNLGLEASYHHMQDGDFRNIDVLRLVTRLIYNLIYTGIGLYLVFQTNLIVKWVRAIASLRG